MFRLSRGVACLLCCSLLGACGFRSFGAVRVQSGVAEERLAVTSLPQAPPINGQPTRPHQIVCLEPSPDVAKAVATAFQAGASANVQGPPAGTPPVDIQAAIAISKSHSEAIAQLGERLATIQLLRDGLYRACEAYANGAVGPISYALVLSRYGDTMVTLLGSELVAGAFGRSLAGASAAAEGDANAALSRARTDDAAAKATETELKDARQKAETLDQELKDARAKDTAAQLEAPSAETKAAEVAVRQNGIEIETLRRRLPLDLQAAATSRAHAEFKVAGGIPGAGGNRTDVAKQLVELQQTYIRAPHLPPLVVACVTALQQFAVPRTGKEDEGVLTPFANECKGEQGLLNNITQAAVRLVGEETRINGEIKMIEANASLARARENLIDKQILLEEAKRKPVPQP